MGFFYNLDEEAKNFAQKKTVFCLVIYDIISNKRRLKLSKLLEGYGMRVQRSCFEIDVEKNKLSSPSSRFRKILLSGGGRQYNCLCW